METVARVAPFAPRKGTGRTIYTAIPVRAEIDPKDARNCLSASWKSRSGYELFEEDLESDIPGRCPGMGTVLDTGDLVCDYFIRADPTAFRPLEVSADAMLRTPDGEIAQWGTKKPVRRCAPCIIGEQLMKKNRTA